MYKRKLLLLSLFALFMTGLYAQRRSNYVRILDDAHFDVGVKMAGIFALDDKAPLSANPHFQAMWNLVRLGATLESLMQGMEEPLNNINLDQEYGQNGYNKTTFAVFFRYGFGESSDVALQQQFLELNLGPGYFKDSRGMHIHLEYQFNIMKTPYGAGVNSISRTFDYEVYVGARTGFDWSSRRSESEAGFFDHLNTEIERIAFENDFTAAQLVKLGSMLKSSKVLFPKDVGGRAFHIGPVAGGRLSKQFLKNARLFVEGTAFYDVMDMTGSKKKKENQRSQHSISLMLGLNLTLGSEGEVVVTDFF